MALDLEDILTKTYGYIDSGGERGEIQEIRYITAEEICIDELGSFILTESNLEVIRNIVDKWVKDHDAWEVEQ